MSNLRRLSAVLWIFIGLGVNKGVTQGLKVEAAGKLTLNDKPYSGVGVNYYSAFVRNLGPTIDTTYKHGFRYLRARKIPFIRFNAAGYWPNDWKLYLENKDEYFRRLDEFIATAEDNQIGLIPSLFWHFATVPDLMKEPVSAWGKVDSKTHHFMRNYVKEVVSRYQQSSAIWGWELGNEYNLELDLPGTNHLPPVAPHMGTPEIRTIKDRLTTPDLQVALKAFSEEVRKYDSDRLIISGNAINRPAAWHLHKQQNWQSDTPEQYLQMLDLHQSSELNTYSVHVYPDADAAFFNDSTQSISDILRVTMQHAKSVNKVVFLGEFGAQEAKYGANKAKEKFHSLLQAIERNNIPLAAVWVFDYPPHNVQEGINIGPDNGPREYMLQAIQALNERLLK